VKIQILSKKTKGGLFVQFDITDLNEEETDKMMMDPPGDMYRALVALDEEMHASGEICDSPDTGLQEKIEPMSDTSSVTGGYYEVRDEPASEAVIERIRSIFPDADIDVEYI
jgi:hypothetical protein